MFPKNPQQGRYILRIPNKVDIFLEFPTGISNRADVFYTSQTKSMYPKDPPQGRCILRIPNMVDCIKKGLMYFMHP